MFESKKKTENDDIRDKVNKGCLRFIFMFGDFYPLFQSTNLSSLDLNMYLSELCYEVKTEDELISYLCIYYKGYCKP
jgi:hypothetical protein